MIKDHSHMFVFGSGRLNKYAKKFIYKIQIVNRLVESNQVPKSSRSVVDFRPPWPDNKAEWKYKKMEQGSNSRSSG